MPPSKGLTATFLQRLWFEFRACGLRLIRGVRDRKVPFATEHSRCGNGEWPHTIGESISPLWTAQSPGEEMLVAGKVQNLRVAAALLDGRVIEAGKVFSFWKCVGVPSRSRGFVTGRELREGCMVANVGGGLCQLSNALHLAALDAGLEIVERHGHSRVIPGSIAETGRDATVFWNYIDLRFRSNATFVLETKLDAENLTVRLRSAKAPARLESNDPVPVAKLHHADDCVECRHTTCVYHLKGETRTERRALLLDECWPEFDAWLAKQNFKPSDIALVPIDGTRRNRAAYAWFKEFKEPPQIREHFWHSLKRSLKLRRLRAQGAERQKALLEFDRQLAHRYAREIPIDCRELVVSLRYLPHLAQTGALGGRRVTVLLDRSPLFLLHQQLDRAANLYPRSGTIADFRAAPELVEAERSALAQADLIVTPHVWVAGELRKAGFARIELLPWSLPQAKRNHRLGKVILFPASGLARKGACEIKSACRDLPLAVLGRAVEHRDFWAGTNAQFVTRENIFDNVSCVVLPAHVEHQPRALLAALANGIPVICTAECGLSADLPNVTIVSAGNAEQLRDVITEMTSNPAANLSLAH